MSYLITVMYHYVRDPEGTEAPAIHAVREDSFIEQLEFVTSNYEVVDLEKALSFLRGGYSSGKRLCCLTFDDGLLEHAGFVTDELAKRGIQGIFFLPTACIDRESVLPIHQNHLLLGQLNLADYKSRVMRILQNEFPQVDLNFDHMVVANTYRWDKPEVASLKFLLNYHLDVSIRDHILDAIFRELYGAPREYAAKFYLSWDDARTMIDRGMTIGGHTHTHPILANLSAQQQRDELETCHGRICSELGDGRLWAFSYPHGRGYTFNDHTVRELKRLGCVCSFTSEVGMSQSGEDPFFIKRIDPKDLRMK